MHVFKWQSMRRAFKLISICSQVFLEARWSGDCLGRSVCRRQCTQYSSHDLPHAGLWGSWASSDLSRSHDRRYHPLPRPFHSGRSTSPELPGVAPCLRSAAPRWTSDRLRRRIKIGGWVEIRCLRGTGSRFLEGWHFQPNALYAAVIDMDIQRGKREYLPPWIVSMFY